MIRTLLSLSLMAVVLLAQVPAGSTAPPTPGTYPVPAKAAVTAPAAGDHADASATADLAPVHKPHPGVAGAPPPPPAKGTPKIVCADPTWRFGSIPQSAALKHDFPLKNEGDGTLTISQVLPTCQCTATLPKKTVLEPGESTVIETSLNVSAFQGPVTKSITVISNDPKSPNTVLTVTGEVLPPYAITPKEIVLGKLMKGTDAAASEVRFTITKGGDVQIKEVKSSSSFVEVTPNGGPKTQEDGSRVLTFKVMLKPGMPVGLLRESVTFITDTPTMPMTVVALQANIEGEVQLDPKTFNLGKVKKGESASKELVLTKSGKADLKVEGVDLTPAGPFTAEVITDQAGQRYRIKVTLKADAPDGYHRGTLTIRTNCPGETTLQAYFYAYMGK